MLLNAVFASPLLAADPPIHATAGQTVTTSDDYTIELSGGDQIGVSTQDSASVTLGDRASVTIVSGDAVSGWMSYGAIAEGDDSQIVFGNSAEITIDGLQTKGAVAEGENSSITLGNGTTITLFNGDQSYGALVGGTNAKIVFSNDTTITTEGRQTAAVGIDIGVDDAAVLFGDRTQLIAEGVYAKGVESHGAGSRVEFGDNTYIEVTGAETDGVYLGVYENSVVKFGDNARIVMSGDQYVNALRIQGSRSDPDGAGSKIILGASADLSANGYAASIIDIAGKGSEVEIGDNAKFSVAGEDAYAIRLDGYGFSSKVKIGDNVSISGDVDATYDYGTALIQVEGNGDELEIGDNAKITYTYTGSEPYAESPVLYAQGYGTKISVGDNASFKLQDMQTAVYVFGGQSQVTFGDSLDIEVNSEEGRGIYVTPGWGSGSTVKAGDDAKVVVSGDWAIGVLIDDTGGHDNMSVEFGDNAKIHTYGEGAIAVAVWDGSKVTMKDDAYLVASGDYSTAVDAGWGGRVEMGNNATIDASGVDTAGILAFGSSMVPTVVSAGNNLRLSVSGDMDIGSAEGINATGGFVDIGSGAALSVEGFNASGIVAFDDGAQVSVDRNARISVSGNAAGGYAQGVYTYSDAEVSLGSGASIDVTGYLAKGLYAYNTNAHISADQDLEIYVEGYNATGIQSQLRARIDVADGASVRAEGYAARGVVGNNTSGDVVIGGNLKVTASGDNAIGLMATANSNGNYDGSSVTTGENTLVTITGNAAAAGVYAARGTVTTGSGAQIFLTGSDSYGARAVVGGLVDLGANALVQVDGNDTYGVAADNGGRALIAAGALISTSGDNGYGLYTNNGSIVITGSAVATDGAGAHGVYSRGTSGDIDMTGSTISVANNDSWFMVTGEGGRIRLANMAVGDSVNLNLLKTSSSGDVLAQNTALTGDVVHDGTTAGLLSLTLSGDSSLTGKINALAAGSAVDLALSGNTWNITGDSHTRGALSMGAGGIVDYSGAALGTVARVNALSGSGDFIMKTDIVARTGDLLIVDGTSDGDHSITVANSGSAATTGRERVTLVETADTDSTFMLTNGVVDLGAYQYKLGVNSGDGMFANGQYWELYAEGGSDPDSSNPGSAAINTFVAGYLLNYAETNTLIQRLGDLRSGQQYSREGYWFRAFGGKFKDFKRSYVRDFDMTYGGVQVGYDHRLENSWFSNGDTYVGAFVGYSDADLDYTRSGSYGNGGAENKSMGMYATYIGNNGFYVDAIAKYVWSELDFDVLDSAGTTVTGDDVNSGGVGLSLETGKRIRFAKSGKNNGGWYIEPQLQLSWQHMSGGYFNASNGLRIGLDSYDSLLGRAGVLVGYETDRTNFYAKVSFVKEFDGDMKINANGVDIFESMDDDWLVYGLGVTHQLNARNALYLDFERASEGKFTQDWAIKGGWRISF